MGNPIDSNAPVARKAALIALVTTIIADGKVDANEVSDLRTKFYEDGKIDRDECDAIFQINDAVSGAENDPGWDELFSDIVSDHICADGKLDEEEANYLMAKMMADGGVDAPERMALVKIRAKATEIFPAFDEAMKSLGI